jgi:diacylglycerol O-acyltransferase
VERLGAEDRLILWPDQVWPQDIGALGVLDATNLVDSDGRFRIEAATQAIEGRLHLLPRFRQVLSIPGRGLGGPLWVDAPAFNLSDHVHVERLQPPADEGQLLQAVARLRRRRLDLSRPLWEMWFLTGLGDSRIGWFVRLHHVVADGIAGVADLGALLDAAPSSSTASAPWAPEPWPSARVLFLDNLGSHIAKLGHALGQLRHPIPMLRRARAAVPALRELLAEKPGPQTSLNQVIGNDRILAQVRSSLELVNEAAHRHHAKVNDVLLTVIAGGLRELLRSRGESIEGLILPIYVPVSLRRGRPKSRWRKPDHPDGRSSSPWDRRSQPQATPDRCRDRETEGDRPSLAWHHVPQQTHPRPDAEAHCSATRERRERRPARPDRVVVFRGRQAD